jgi:phage terminase large subunit-like protein
VAVAAPPADPASTYAAAVLAGEIIAGPLVRAACQRHLNDLEHGHERGLVWDPEAAAYAMEFIGYLRLPEGEVDDDTGEVKGNPFVLYPAQQFIVGSLFGWYRRDGERRFRTAYIEMGKGSGKTPLAAAVGLLGLVGDQQPAAEVYTAGVTREQAAYLFDDARKMAVASKALHSRLEIQAGNVATPKLGGFMRPVSSEGRSLDQKRVYMALVDELHEHPSGVVVQKMRFGTKGRANALIFEITNSGFDRHSICWQHHDYSRKVVEGLIDGETADSWFAFVCGLDEGDEWTDPKVWPKANPGIGYTVTERYLREQVDEGLAIPAAADLVKRLNLCIWTEASAGAFDMTRWDACNGEPMIAPGSRVWEGIDLSSTTDVSAVARISPRIEQRTIEPEPGLFESEDVEVVDVEMRFYVPREGARRRAERDRVPYLQWIDEGLITATTGDVVDQDAIKVDLAEAAADYEVVDVGFDPWNSTKVVTELVNEGAPMTAVRQGYGSLNAPMKYLLDLVASGRLRHGGHPVLRWMASNTVVEVDPAGNVKPSKRLSTERIDGIAALVTAIARYIATTNEEDDGPSVWEMPVKDGGRRSLTI